MTYVKEVLANSTKSAVSEAAKQRRLGTVIRSGNKEVIKNLGR